jgi:hypothetical protein
MTEKTHEGDTTDGETPDMGEGAPSRDEIMSLLEDGIREAHRKVKAGRVYDPENERVRQKWIRTLAYAANQYRQLKKDEDLEAIDERLTELENNRKETNGEVKI